MMNFPRCRIPIVVVVTIITTTSTITIIIIVAYFKVLFRYKKEN